MDISVITPFYKGNSYMEGLFGCVRACAAAAPRLSVELVLVNDSPDCAVEYDPKWVQGFTLNLVTNSQNSGIHRSRVNGLSAARGLFIQFLDQDDLLEPQTFVSQFALTKSADVVVANGIDQNPNSCGRSIADLCAWHGPLGSCCRLLAVDPDRKHLLHGLDGVDDAVEV